MPALARRYPAVFLAPEDIAHAGHDLFLRERVSCVTEFAGCRLWARGGAGFLCLPAQAAWAKEWQSRQPAKWSLTILQF